MCGFTGFSDDQCMYCAVVVILYYRGFQGRGWCAFGLHVYSFCDDANYKLNLFPLASNLIQPPGMMLRPAVFDLRVFRAEDIPQSRF